STHQATLRARRGPPKLSSQGPAFSGVHSAAMRTLALALICLSAACGTDGGNNPPGGTPDAPGGGGETWTTLIEKSWTLPPGSEILEVDPGTVTDEVDMFLPGPRNLSIAPNQTSTQSGTCTVRSAQTLIALFPHMHQLGSHFKTTIHTAAGDRVIHDGDYSFEHQAVIGLDSIKLAVGDTITTECTWKNTTAATVTYGESSTTEMCYSILYRYPRGTE